MLTNGPIRMQHFLKPMSGAAKAEVVPAQFLRQFLPAMDNAVTAPDVSFGREPLAALAAGLVEKSCCNEPACRTLRLTVDEQIRRPLAKFFEPQACGLEAVAQVKRG
jgi:hypothetical protein